LDRSFAQYPTYLFLPRPGDILINQPFPTPCHPVSFFGADPLVAVLQTSALPIRQREASIPKPLAEVIDLALVNNPEIHFKTAAELKQKLLSVL
jgi:hypothetical protein